MLCCRRHCHVLLLLLLQYIESPIFICVHWQCDVRRVGSIGLILAHTHASTTYRRTYTDVAAQCSWEFLVRIESKAMRVIWWMCAHDVAPIYIFILFYDFLSPHKIQKVFVSSCGYGFPGFGEVKRVPWTKREKVKQNNEISWYRRRKRNFYFGTCFASKNVVGRPPLFGVQCNAKPVFLHMCVCMCT